MRELRLAESLMVQVTAAIAIQMMTARQDITANNFLVLTGAHLIAIPTASRMNILSAIRGMFIGITPVEF